MSPQSLHALCIGVLRVRVAKRFFGRDPIRLFEHGRKDVGHGNGKILFADRPLATFSAVLVANDACDRTPPKDRHVEHRNDAEGLEIVGELVRARVAKHVVRDNRTTLFERSQVARILRHVEHGTDAMSVLPELIEGNTAQKPPLVVEHPHAYAFDVKRRRAHRGCALERAREPRAVREGKT